MKLELRIASDVQDVWDRSWATPWVWPMLPTYNFVVGVLLIIGGDDQISSPSFAAIREIGSLPVGIALVLVGVGLVVALGTSRRAMQVVGWVAMLAHLGLAAGFLTAVLAPPEPPLGWPVGLMWPKPSWLGPPTYLLVAALHFANAALYGSRGPARSSERSPTVSDDDPDIGPDAGEAGVRA